MELQYYGANAVKITTKKSTIVTDPKSDITTLRVDLKKATLILATQDAFIPNAVPEDAFVVNFPGEYEFADATIKAVAVQAHTGSPDSKGATVYRVEIADMKVLIIGHIFPTLSDEQLEQIGLADIVITPIGNSGYTLDATGAAGLVRAIEPKLVIPVHYSDGMKYDVLQQGLEPFLKEMGVEPEQAVEKLKIKNLPEKLTIQPLIRQ